MRTRRALAVAAFAVMFMLIVTMLGGVVSAHHGRAGYYGNTTTKVEGVVTQLVWKNPHVFVMFDVKDDKGNVVQWTGEFSSVTTMLSEGMTRNSFKPGDKIAVTGRAAEGGVPHTLVVKIEKADGSVAIDLSERRGGER